RKRRGDEEGNRNFGRGELEIADEGGVMQEPPQDGAHLRKRRKKARVNERKPARKLPSSEQSSGKDQMARERRAHETAPCEGALPAASIAGDGAEPVGENFRDRRKIADAAERGERKRRLDPLRFDLRRCRSLREHEVIIELEHLVVLLARELAQIIEPIGAVFLHIGGRLV